MIRFSCYIPPFGEDILGCTCANSFANFIKEFRKNHDTDLYMFVCVAYNDNIEECGISIINPNLVAIKRECERAKREAISNYLNNHKERIFGNEL